MNLVRKLILERKDKRPPFLKAPLNAPGASLRDRLDDKLTSMSSGFMTGPGILGVSIALSPMMKDELSVPILVAMLLGAWVIWIFTAGRKLRIDIQKIRLGYLGEVLVGQELERTRAFGCCAYHDIVNEKPKFNIDHILIGEVGVMVFETKARSKPRKGDTTIVYREGALHFSDGRYSKAELDQAKRNQQYIKKLLLQLINDSNKASLMPFYDKQMLPVETCLVFPGWHADYKSAYGSGVNLTNDKMLFNFVSSQAHRNKRLSAKQASDLNEIVDAYLRKKKEHLIEV